MNYRLIATEVGDLVKWDTSVNEIRRTAYALFQFNIEEFPNNAISSERAQIVYDCILSLAKQSMDNEVRNDLLVTFCKKITPEQHQDRLRQILEGHLGLFQGAEREAHEKFIAHGFHLTVIEHCKHLFAQENYFHAVFEACKVYDRLVQTKSKSTSNGESLMMNVWGCDKGVLKLTRCESDTDKNVQDGIKFLSAGLMRAMRNPTAHEPALHWPIGKQDCLDMLSFISFLFRQLDKAVYFNQ
uniref:TIGR02391 family protein n=1 Tax=Candidatus Kentrum sp. LPFa TaxID=2126335 RepID=A0A450XNC8_9GAMM|nr:MAG: TIGR02391 family protein [Candidatus Kentron sp. LPFa]VFK30764.1 MAG: TIGR02391 family protein [Candidatus Kentron sp. LPFa]